MKRKGLLILALFSIILSGCGTTMAVTNTNDFAVGKTTRISNYRVLQTLNSHFALALDESPTPNIMVVAIRTSENHSPFYDGQKIGGLFVMIDTYTYETNPDNNGVTRVKTVPLIIPKDDYSGK